jgi:hypothetical protein
MKSGSLVIPPALSRKLSTTALATAAILGITAIIAPDRAWANLLLAALFLVTLGLGGALFIALTNVCGAGWSVAFRRVPEALTGLLPLGGALLLVAVLAHLRQYAWHHHGDGDAGTFWFKELWLEPKFFAARAVSFVMLWIAFSRVLVNQSRRQDTMADASASVVTSILFLAMFAITISLAGVDWIMALEPMWFSTMWGVYQFSGLILSTLAAMIIACILLRRYGPLAGVFRDDHLHDLSKLLLGFSCFWMYIWFSQYMLIWYSNLPEETSYFVTRTHGSWGPIVVASIVLNWVIPFFVLLPRPCKRNEGIMLKISIVVLLGRWVDLYVMRFPPTTGNTPVFGIPEVATIIGLCCLIPLLFMRSFAAAEPVPRNDPWLAESLHYHA